MIRPMRTAGQRVPYRIMTATALFVLMCCGISFAGAETPDEAENGEELQEKAVEVLRYASIRSGYRFVTPNGPAAAASPYGRLASGVTGGVSAGSLGSDLKLSIDGSFLHEDDYRTELFFDYRGLVRFHAESTALWNNLLREQINPGTLTLLPAEQDRSYGNRTAISQADTRIKLGNRPIHLNLGYWELTREGYGHMRFSDHYFGTAANSLITGTMRVDSVTREGSAGLDAHLGVFDMSYGFRIRDFSNQAPAPRYAFTADASGIPTGDRHNVIPDSSVTSHTVKMFTDLSGGLVGSASYNLTLRENNGSHGDAVPSARPSDVIQSIIGDLSYTPSKRHSFALKYRHREIDRTTPDTLFYPFSQIQTPPAGILTAAPGELKVRPASSSVKDTLTFSATFRPGPKVIYRLEYNVELEGRSNIRNVLAPAGSPTELHSDSRQSHTGTATFYWKPVKGGKLNATYSYATCSDPAYGTSFSGRHTGKLLATYTTSTRWGLTGNYLAQFDSGSQRAFTVAPAPVASYDLPKESRSHSANASVWFSPLERVTVTTHYSYQETDSSQSLLFANLIADPDPHLVSNYHSSSHVYGIDVSYAVSEPLDFSAAFQQMRSQSRFKVPDRDFTLAGVAGPFNTTGLTGLSRLDTTETGVTARADWRISEKLGCSLDYSFRKFASGQPLYDGSVHSTMVLLKARW